MKLKGTAHKFGDDINTDYIISGRYKFSIQDPHKLARHVMEDIRPNFIQKIKKGDFIIAGKNFGCGSSREQAPIAIKYAGIKAVIAKSFSRIFFRNCINIGLPVFECNTSSIKDADKITLDTNENIIKNQTQRKEIPVKPLPDFMLRILKDGGLIQHFKKYRGFKINTKN